MLLRDNQTHMGIIVGFFTPRPGLAKDAVFGRPVLKMREGSLYRPVDRNMND